MRILESALIGFLVVMLLALGISIGRRIERETAPRAESVMRGDSLPSSRGLNMPLLPEVPNKGLPGQRTRF